MQEVIKPIILHLTSVESGGAGMFTMDFHQSILSMGYDSYVAVRGKRMIYPDGSIHSIKETKIYLWNKLKRYVFRKIVKHSHVDNAYSMHNLCERFTCHSAADTIAAMPVKPNVVFVHWVSDYANAEFIAELKQCTNAKIAYIIIDHAIYSGGCHYQIDCQGYKDGCHHCPATSSQIIKRGIEKNYAFRKKYLPKEIILVNGEDDRKRLSQSAIYKDFLYEQLIFSIDADKFFPIKDKGVLREKWHISKEGKVVFFGSTSLDERRKGIKELIEALSKVHTKDVIFVAAGNSENLTLPENTISVGYLNESQLIEMYQMADVFVCPSLADSGPMMVNQSMMCGTPVVAFPVGVSVEMVLHGKTGYLAKYADSTALAKGIDDVLCLSHLEWQQMSNNCRKLAVDKYANPKKQNCLKEFIQRMVQ